MEHHYITPAAQETANNILRHDINATTVEDAEDFFIYAKNSLLSVNSWKQYSSSISASFELINNSGYVLHRQAHMGDNIRISAPGNIVYRLHIDTIVYDDYPDEDTESITMYLSRPEDNANGSQCAIAVERTGTHIYALCTGVEEMAPLPEEQLNTLVTGFIDFEEK